MRGEKSEPRAGLSRLSMGLYPKSASGIAEIDWMYFGNCPDHVGASDGATFRSASVDTRTALLLSRRLGLCGRNFAICVYQPSSSFTPTGSRKGLTQAQAKPVRATQAAVVFDLGNAFLFQRSERSPSSVIVFPSPAGTISEIPHCCLNRGGRHIFAKVQQL